MWSAHDGNIGETESILFAISEGEDRAVEIKNMTLTHSETYSTLTSLESKLPLVQDLSNQIPLGVVAREIEDVAEFRKEGFYCMEPGGK